MTSTLTYRLAARTDIGLKRSVNEDNFEVFEIPGTQAAFVVCDGMGGLKAGDIASAEATRAIGTTLQSALANGRTAPGALDEALRAANDAVNALPRPGRFEDPTVRLGSPAKEAAAVIGTTAVAGLVVGEKLYLGHAGDSRAYRVRGDKLARLTDDHSFVAEQVRQGNMSEAEARKSRFRNMITRAVGIDPNIQPDLLEETLRPDDLILVCSDGLTTMLEDHEIEEHMLSPRFAKLALEGQVESLIDAANKRGGSDNTTVLLLKVYGSGDAPALSSTAIGPAPSRRDPAALKVQADDEDRSAKKPKSGKPSPVLVFLAVAGVFALLALAALFGLPDARKALGFNLLQMNGMHPENLNATPVPTLQPDVVYDPAQELARDEIARGDILHYVPGKGLYFVTKSQGQGRLIGPTGQVLSRSIAPKIPENVQTLDGSKSPTYTATDDAGSLYVSRTAQKIIEKYDASGKFLTRIAGLQRPEAIAVDEKGSIYVVDFNTIKVISAHPKTIGPGAKPKGK